MGLSGRQVKQRLQADPRNLSWADDAQKFGAAYLSKFGWDSSQGLGAAGDGVKSHIKVSHKLDMLGIGAAQRRDPDGLAWKQNQEFEALLTRLNQQGGEEGQTTPPVEQEQEREEAEGEESTPTPTQNQQRFRPHRKRIVASKKISQKSGESISEILGVAPSAKPAKSTLSGFSAATCPVDQIVSPITTTVEETIELGIITTSTMNVADYFKERMSLKRLGGGTFATTSSTSSSSTSLTPAAMNPRMKREDEDEDEKPRFGIGSSSLRQFAFQSFVRPQSKEEAAEIDVKPEMTEDVEGREEVEVEPARDKKLEKAGKRDRKGKVKEVVEAKLDEQQEGAKEEVAQEDESEQRSKSKKSKKRNEKEPSSTPSGLPTQVPTSGIEDKKSSKRPREGTRDDDDDRAERKRRKREQKLARKMRADIGGTDAANEL